MLNAAALAITGLTLTAVVSGSTVAQAAGAGTVSGTAYVDYNYDGSRSRAGGASTVYDNGIPNVAVSVTDSGGTVVGTATTAADGTYSISVSGATSTDVRVEFTPPAGYIAGVHGSQSGSTVQFVTLGTSSASGVDVTFAHPGDYSQTTVPRLLQVQEYGAITATSGQFVDQTARPSLTSSGYTTSGTQASTQSDITTHATMAQTGEVWGVAQINAQFAFTAAHFRRHAFIGPSGLGGIYLTDLTSNSANAKPFVTIPNAGTDPRTNPTQSAMSYNDWYHDPQAFPQVGKIGLGGIAMAPDNSALYVVNLADKNLYEVPLTYAADGTPIAATPVVITMPTALPGAATKCGADSSNVRPFGVSAQNGALWVTETCVGPNTSDLRGYVYRYDLGTGKFGSTPAFETALSGYQRGQTYDGAQTAAWRAWSDTFSTVATNQNANATGPMPLLSDVSFDYNGDMTIGVKDRFADEVSYKLGSPTSSDTNAYEGFSGGDLLRACGTEASGWTLENNGTCGTRTGYTTTNANNNTNINGVGDGQGPGGGEFYSDNYGGSHQQILLGATLQVPGYPETVDTSYDPGAAVRASGQRFESNADGSATRYHTLQDTVNANSPANVTGSFGKGGGLGDLTALVTNAPIELGNRLWFDTNANGIQDAGEAPVSGATVNLYAAGGSTALATATTASDGTYYFSSAAGTSTASARYGIGGLTPNTNYTVRVDNASDYATGGPLAGYAATRATVGSDRSVDSNGLTTPQGTTSAAVTTQGPGVNDHTIDFGFVKPASVGDFVWADTNRNGVQDAGEPGLSGVTVSITKADGTAATHSDGTAVASVQTDGNGNYTFTNLAPGVAYKVSVATPTGYAPTKAGQGSDTTKDSSTGSATTAVLPSGGSDTSLDFGFVKPAVSVGDYVFFDANHNGIQDGGDTGIANVRVTIVGPDGNAVTDVNGTAVGSALTDANGKYSFANLPALPAGKHYTVNINNSQTTLVSAGYRPTRAQASGSTTANDSSTASATSTDLTTDGASDPTLDFGFVQSVNVGDFVWNDLDADGIQDTNEPGIGGVQLTIVGPTGQPVTDTLGNTVGPATTDANGGYHFANLPVLSAGQHYTVRVDNSQAGLAGYVPTKAGQGTDPRQDSSTSSADSGALTTPDASDTTLDFGFVKPVTVGDFVWRDTDRDGIQDGGEPGIPDVVVQLSRVDGQPVVDANGNTLTGGQLTRTTGSDGKYTFANLAPGVAYTVTVTTGPAGLIPTTAGAGGDRTADSSTGSASTAVLGSGGIDNSLDFGYVQPAVSVGDFVWRDRNRNGVQDTGERGIAGISLTLVGPTGGAVTDVYGNPVGAATTDANGKYAFNNLPALAAGQHYTVKLDNSQAALGNYIPTKTGQGTTATDSSNGSATSGDLTTDGSSDPTLDFGFVVPSVSVGDFVWQDANGDGVQQSGDTGIEGVTLTLVGPTGAAVTDVFGNAVQPARTDADGKYSFDNLPALATGQHYTVKVDNSQSTLAGFVPTKTGQGTTATDSSTASADSGNLTTQDARDATLDFGFVKPVTVGDFVWVDTDGDGLQGAGEPGIAGVTLSIKNADGTAVTDLSGNPVTTTTTDANGRYSFTNLPPGQYRVTVTPPSGYSATLATVGSNTAIDSSTGSATSATLTSGGSDQRLDFGFVKPVTVGDLVWRDINGNGVQDVNDPGIKGVTVTLSNAADGSTVTDLDGNQVAAATTGDDGKYSFGDLRPGQYTVTVTTPSGYAPTLANSTDATLATDSSTGTATSQVLASGGADSTLDFGFVQTAAVGDFVWDDLNHNGIQDPGEPGLQGVTVTISRPDGQPVLDGAGNPVPATTTTDSTGHYLFDDLEPGHTYTVTVTNPNPSVYLPTATGQGTPDTDSSTGSATTASAVGPTDVDRSLDFGFVLQAATVGDFVWDDLNRDGIQQNGEPGVPGVTLTLQGPNGDVTDIFGHKVGPTTTDANGKYTFTGLPTLPAGQHYTVEIDNGQAALTSRGFIPTITGQGTTDTDSSNGSAESGDLVNNGDTDQSLDFGFIRPTVSVGDFVWQDSNGNGVQDTGEPGIQGVVLTITGPGGAAVKDTDGNPVGAVTTGPDGKYSFTNLPALPAGQSYTVHVDNGQDTLTGYRPTRPSQGPAATDSSTGSAASGNLTMDGAADTSLDFGFVNPVGVGDFVWEDLNGNGVQDSGEPGIANATLTLVQLADNGMEIPGTVTDADGNSVAPATSGSDGAYLFGDLYPGTYRVTVTLPGGYSPTLARVGTNSALDSSSGHEDTMPLLSGQSDRTLDFGAVRPATVGDFVWNDVNRNGVQDAGEPGLPNVGVSITRADGTPATHPDGTPLTSAERAITTGSDGKYSFVNLAPGSYTVTVATPTTPNGLAYVPTLTGQGNTSTDSSTGSGTSRTLTSNGTDRNVDFGFVVPAVTVGDFVWDDLDRDGLQSANEPGINGVTVTLVGPDGKAVTDVFGQTVGSTTTDANGKYSFGNLPALPAGQHYVVAVDGTQSALASKGFIPTKAGQGADRSLDSSTGSATSGDLAADKAADRTLDFGFFRPTASVGDFVWVDTNGNGIQDRNEPGVQGVRVTLTGPGGAAVTDADGAAVGPLTTDANGGYLFTNLPTLPAGQHYTVNVDNSQSALAGAGYVPTVAGSGSDRSVDSSTSKAISTDLTSDKASDTSLDFGFVKPVRVGNFVWVDTNGNGIQDSGESGLAGVTVALRNVDGSAVTDVNGNPVGPITTGTDGAYSFGQLQPGTYTVVVASAPAGYSPTQQHVGTDTSVDSSTGSVTSMAITSGGNDRTLDFGFVKPVSVGDFVWVDANGDGVQDNNEPGIEGATVTLAALDSAGNPVAGSVHDVDGKVVAAQHTDADGKYSFSNLLPGRYRVQITTPDGFYPTKSGQGDATTDSSRGFADSKVLPSGASDPTLDFGFLRAVTVGDFVWNDSNANGVQDSGEPGIAGVTVTITRTDGSSVLAPDGSTVPTAQLTQQTDAQGQYLFTGLGSGQYTVTVTPPTGYLTSPSGAGNDNAKDSSTGSAQTGTLSSGDTDSTVDFGFFLAATVGDFVWFDINRDGIQQAGEPGIAGVTVTLTDVDGNAVTDVNGKTVAPVTTDANGKYLFTDLLPGKRYVAHVDNGQPALATFLPTKAGAGNDPSRDSANGQSTSAGLVSGGKDLTLDFGFYSRAVTVGDFVWSDTNGDGRQGKGEPGIGGVHLRIVGPDGKAVTDILGRTVGEVTTDSHGHYLFTNLPALAAGQHYTVGIDTVTSRAALAGDVPTRSGVGPATTDSSTATADSGDLTKDGDADLTLDFGYFRPVMVGQQVYLDENGDGRYDDGDKPIAGVLVTLTDADGHPVTDANGKVVGPVRTDSNGQFLFNNLPPGTYTAHIDNNQPALSDYRPTKTGPGSSDGAATTVVLHSGQADLGLVFGFVSTKPQGFAPGKPSDGHGAVSSGTSTPGSPQGFASSSGSASNGTGTTGSIGAPGSPADTGVHGLLDQLLIAAALLAVGALVLLAGTRRGRGRHRS